MATLQLRNPPRDAYFDRRKGLRRDIDGSDATLGGVAAPRLRAFRLRCGVPARDDLTVPRSQVVPGDAVPSPELVAAWFVVEQAALERVPWWAANWLAAGRDGDALRELAGLNGRDVRAVRDLLPDALAEMSVDLPTAAVAAAALVFDDLARRCLAGEAGELWVAQVVEEIVVRADYSSEVIDLPLGHLYGVDDEWGAGWGRSVEQLRAVVRAACLEQLRTEPDPG